MKSLEAARKLIENVYLIDNYLINFEIFVFNPRLGCINCGSSSHSSCTGDQSCEEMKSYIHCASKEHISIKCPVYLAKVATAKSNKKKSYAEALALPAGLSSLKTQAVQEKSSFSSPPQNSTKVPTSDLDFILKITFQVALRWLDVCEGSPVLP